jgi:hypothetical protein
MAEEILKSLYEHGIISRGKKEGLEALLKLGGSYKIVTTLYLGSWPHGYGSHVHWSKVINSEEEFISFMKSNNARLDYAPSFPRYTCDYHSRNHKHRHYTLWIETKMVVSVQTRPQIICCDSCKVPHPDWVLKYIEEKNLEEDEDKFACSNWSYITKFNN